jgi:uncharacterized membrane protein YhaH (DUF805 family)
LKDFGNLDANFQEKNEYRIVSRIGRLAYADGHLGIIIFLAFYIGFLVTSSAADQAFMPQAVAIMAGGGSLALTVARLQNIGKSFWWIVGCFVPFMNLYIVRFV